MHIYMHKEKILFSGEGIEFLRTKAKVVVAVGDALLMHEGMGKFSIPKDAATLVADIIAESDSNSPELQNAAATTRLHDAAKKRALEIMETKNLAGFSSRWKSQLKEYQAIAVRAMSVPDLLGMCLFDEQGTGKTIMSIAAFDMLRKDKSIEKALVVCPKSVLTAWEKDFDTFSPEYRVVSVTGGRNQKISALSEAGDAYLLNYESILDLLTRLTAFAQKYKCLLVADESFYVKNANAKRSKALRELRNHCVRSFALCGTPAPNNAIDLIHQFNIADGGYTFRGFKPTGDRVRDAEFIHRAVHERGLYLRRMKGQVLPGLPLKKFELVYAEMKGEQARLYKEAKDDLVLHLRTMDNQDFQRGLVNYLAKRSALLQICACPAEQSPLFAGEHAKIEALDNLLGRLIEQENRKVVVWSFYRASLAEIVDRYSRYGVVKIDGSTPTAERKTAVKMFQEDTSIRLFVGNPAAAGAGITLHAAADTVFVSFSSQAAHFMQALDRTHRIGQTAEEVRYHLIICNGTIEKNEVRVLREKELRQHRLLDNSGGEWPSSLEEALTELEEDDYHE